MPESAKRLTSRRAFYILGGIMRAAVLRRIVSVTIFAWIVSSSRVSAPALNTNLIVNPGAEASAGAASFPTTSPPSGWTTTSNMTAVQYAIGGASDLNNRASTAINGGNNYFAGGPNNSSSSASQTINLAGLATSIDAGRLQGVLSGYLGGLGAEPGIGRDPSWRCMACNESRCNSGPR